MSRLTKRVFRVKSSCLTDCISSVMSSTSWHREVSVRPYHTDQSLQIACRQWQDMKGI